MVDISFRTVDLSNISWSFGKDSPGTAGMYLKSRIKRNNTQYFLKLSAYNSYDGVYGNEVVYEIIAQRVAKLLGIHYLHMYLFPAKVCLDGKKLSTYVVCSKDYRDIGEERVSFEMLYQLYGKGMSTEEFILSDLMEKYRETLLGMLVLDYIIYNRDRHSNNIEFLYNPIKNLYRIAPIMDHGCCLTSVLYDDWKSKDSTYFSIDSPVNNCIGSFSLLTNLKNICKGRIYYEGDAHLPESIMGGISKILGGDLSDFIYNMLEWRWNNALEILNS